jgi:hypothetical protein
MFPSQELTILLSRVRIATQQADATRSILPLALLELLRLQMPPVVHCPARPFASNALNAGDV